MAATGTVLPLEATMVPGKCMDSRAWVPRVKPQLHHSQAARSCMCYFCKVWYADEKEQLWGKNKQCQGLQVQRLPLPTNRSNEAAGTPPFPPHPHQILCRLSLLHTHLLNALSIFPEQDQKSLTINAHFIAQRTGACPRFHLGPPS